jgi:hypothetical protein
MTINAHSNRYVDRAIQIIEKDCSDLIICSSFEVPRATLNKVNRVFRLCSICSGIMHTMLVNKFKEMYKFEKVVYCETPDRLNFERLIFR